MNSCYSKWGILLLLFSSNLAVAQAEHYLGIIGGKVIGPIYTLQHNRWNVTATGGWLTGFKGGYASVTGKYRLLQDGRGMLMVYAGLGLFGQKYTALNAQQERFAKKMEYDTPFGVQLASKLQVKFSEKWTYGMHIVAPLTLSEQKDNIGRQKNIGHWWLEMFQLSLQYRLQTTGKSKK